ncbi:NADH-quinone oxidoreductase subunit NuoN [Rudanella paleaurantiibacter]|uniref:NADH-quinone oxidoreductase subunit N n=1 Tax=Rudanella paleaurantiibacter TaxID=2614655 RepID=A0A7J5TWV8_9BACT|nr:NADH-quinone oxidoreductase subunit N [Rudanella paleaurantiibacter]KAB7729122.1 NADH-quinone oxidoreductase subunit NuoN [Rudanella paleaurantiibacter]
MLPIILLSVFGIALLFLGFAKSKAILLPATLLFIAIAFGASFVDWGKNYMYFNDMLLSTNLSIAFTAIVLLSAFMVVSLSSSFLEDESAQPAEYYAIMLFSLVGAIMMISFENLIMLFVGVEILSVAMYVLTGSDKRNLRSNEAALKYFLMGSFATGIMLFGLALLYGTSGSFVLSDLRSYVNGGVAYGSPLLLYMGLLLLLVGILFKVSAAPFHFWTPDVYEGAPTLFTAFMSTVVKTAGFAALLRLLSFSFTGIYSFWGVILMAVTVITLVVSNFTAVYQSSFKRMMAYSSISHAGYLLIALTAVGQQSKQALVFYSLAYSVATIAAFGVLLVVSRHQSGEGKPTDESYDAFNGLARQNPLLGFIMTVAMLSLAGIPLTAGFWGKFMVFTTAANRGIFWLLVVAVLMSAVSIYYYFRVIIAMYLRDGQTTAIRVAPFYRYVLIAATILTIVLGILPNLVRSLV